MAEIPIKKKSSVWPWIIIAAIIAGALILWAALGDDEADYAETEFEPAPTYVETEPIEPIEPMGEVEGEQPQEQAAAEPSPMAVPEDVDTLEGPVTSAEALKTIRPGALDGKELRLEEMKVTRVVGDKTFYVSTSDGDREFFVVLDEERTPGTPTEGRYDVTQGQTVTIQGTVEEMNDADVESFDLTEQEAQAMRGDQLYLKAQQLDVRS